MARCRNFHGALIGQLALEGGEQYCFLEDSDEVSLRGACERDGLRIRFGRCDGIIHPAPDPFLDHV